MAIILIVEDEQPVRKFLELLLTPGYQGVQATDAAQATELVRHMQPDLVLLDVNLRSHPDGLEVCRTLRSEADPLLAQVELKKLRSGS